MHILLITHYYAPEIGAPQRRLSALVSRWRQRGFDVTVLCPPPHYPEKFSTCQLRTEKNRAFAREKGEFGETIVRMPYVLHGYRGSFRALDQLVTAAAATVTALVSRGKNFNLVVSTVPGLPSLFAGVLTAKVLQVPHIAEIRDAWPDVVTGDLNEHVKKISPHKLLVKKAIYHVVTAGQKAADSVVVTTPRFAQKLKDRGVKNVQWVPNGAEAECFARLEPRTPGFIQERQNRAVRLQYLGTVGRSQGLQVLVEALDLLKTQAPEVQIETRIVGSGAEVPRLKALAKLKKISIEFLPNIPRSQLEDAYDWADIELVSLRRTRPFRWTVPSKIFELLATRRFVLAMVEGNAADLVRSSGVGSVVEPENAQALANELRRLAENPDLLTVGNSGVELLKNFYSYDLMEQRYTEVLESLR